LGEPFSVEVYCEPAAKVPVIVSIEAEQAKLSEKKVTVLPGQNKRITVTFAHSDTGVGRVTASTASYSNWEIVVDLGYRGNLKLSSTENLPYGVSTPLLILFVDSDGKPFRAWESSQKLVVEASNLELASSGCQPGNKENSILECDIPSGSTQSPLFEVKPKSWVGGHVELSTRLQIFSSPYSQQNFALRSEPATWLPLVLAISGGILTAVYKISRLTQPGSRKSIVYILITCIVASFVGYLIGSFDVFGLKLDSTVLRSYVLIGFLFSYFGFEVFLADHLPSRKHKHSTDPGSAAD
jgi:hypothetical protein